MTIPTCATCRAFALYAGPPVSSKPIRHGRCRLHPPAVFDTRERSDGWSDLNSAWPFVRADDWCLDHIPAEARPHG